MIVIKSKNIFWRDSFQDGYIIVEDKKIVGFTTKYEGEYLDYSEELILPGLIDTHNHGCFGYQIHTDLNSVEEAETLMAGYVKGLAALGVTSVFPSPGPYNPNMYKAIASFAKKEIPDGAKVVGCHSEGPYLGFTRNPWNQTANRVAPLVDLEVVKEVVSLLDGSLKIMSIAPELDQDYKASEYLNKLGIRVSIAHSGMNEKQTEEAIATGFYNHCTHIGNVMQGMMHRDMGVLGPCILRDNIIAELIGDNHHLSKDCVELVVRVKGWDKIILVSDDSAYTGLPPGKYNLPFRGEAIVTENGLQNVNGGALTGGQPLLHSIKVMHKVFGYPFDEVIKSATIRPAELYDISNKGILDYNMDADFIIINRDFELQSTYVEGKEYFNINKKEMYFNPLFREYIDFDI